MMQPPNTFCIGPTARLFCISAGLSAAAVACAGDAPTRTVSPSSVSSALPSEVTRATTQGDLSVQILEPRPYERAGGNMRIVALVTSSEPIVNDSVIAVIEDLIVLSMLPEGGGLYATDLHTSLLERDMLFPEIRVHAVDAAGNGASDALRFMVDNSVALHLRAVPETLVAGSTVELLCTATRGGEPAPDVQTRLRVEPSPAELLQHGGGADEPTTIAQLTTAGPTEIRCDAPGQDARAVTSTVAVIAGPAHGVDTMLSPDVLVAGELATVRCMAWDAFSNEITDPAATQLPLPPELRFELPWGQDSVITGTRVGIYPLACTAGEGVDPEPAVLTVIAGPPAVVSTQVTPPEVQPEELVEVRCGLNDRYGNPLSNDQTDVVVFPPGGESAFDLAAVGGMAYFSGTRAGQYVIQCLWAGAESAVQDEEPKIVVLRPGEPWGWRVALQERACYVPGDVLPLSFSVSDAWGNTLSRTTADFEPDAVYAQDAGIDSVGGGISVRSDPPGFVVRDGRGRFIMHREGDATLTVEWTGELAADSTIEPVTASIRSDGSPPQLVFDTLLIDGATHGLGRTTMVEGGDYDLTATTLRGRVVDAVSPVVHATLDGESVLQWPPTGDNADPPPEQHSVTFSLPYASRFGLNIITGSTQDACGNVGTWVQSYLRSPAFYPVSTQGDIGAAVPGGITARLSQPLIDDGDRSTLDDLASILQSVLLDLDWNATFPPGAMLTEKREDRECKGGVVWRCDWWGPVGVHTVERSERDDLIVDGPYIDSLTVVDGGLAFDIAIDAFQLPLDAYVALISCACGRMLGRRGIRATMTARAQAVRATGTLSIDAADGEPTVALADLTFDAVDPSVDMHCPSWLDWLCNGVANITVDLLARRIERGVEGVLAQAVPGLVEDYLQGFVIAEEIALGPPLEAVMRVNSGLQGVAFHGPAGSGVADLGFYAQLFSPERAVAPSWHVLGPMAADRAAPVFELGPDQTFGVALHDDVLNQLLWALWYGGALEQPHLLGAPSLDDGGIRGVALSLSAHLPPVITARRDGRPGVELGIGNLALHADVDLEEVLGAAGLRTPRLSVHAFLSAILPATVELGDGEHLQLVFDPDPLVYIEITSIDRPQFGSRMSAVFTDLMRRILPQLLAGVLAPLPLPELDLAAIVGADAQIRLRLHAADLARTASHHRLQGTLR